MKFFTDDYFHIGGAHLGSGKPCQDYALSGVYEKMAFAIVSDGCSTGRHTDVGSRVLSFSTATAIKNHWLIHRTIDVIKTSSEIDVAQKIVIGGMQNILGLIVDDVLATCVYAYVSPEGGVVCVQGDGVVAIKYRDGRILMSNFEWLDNIPYYPAYKNGRLQEFIKAHGDDLKKDCLQEESWMRETNGELISFDVNKYSLSLGIRGVTIDVTKKNLADSIEFIAVFSDGVTQIDGVDWKEAVENFLAFKNTTGAFAKRRMIRGIKDAGKNGKGPVDDISYAVIRIGAKGEEDEDDGKDTE